MDRFVKNGCSVLVLWQNQTSESVLKALIAALSSHVGEHGKVQCENLSRLEAEKVHHASYDVILCGFVSSDGFKDSHYTLLSKMMKPNGSILIQNQNTENGGYDKLCSNLKLSGFINVSKEECVWNTNDTGDAPSVMVVAHTPQFKVGSSAKLSFGKKKTVASGGDTSKADAKKIWSLSAMDMNDDDVELINDDDLLDEADLLKPSADSLKRDCGTGPNKPKKACKDCSCGLAEELEAGNTPKPKTVESSCGSCYLGDAFRCGSCPYLGLPAFKPGEKISLVGNQLAADI